MTKRKKYTPKVGDLIKGCSHPGENHYYFGLILAVFDANTKWLGAKIYWMSAAIDPTKPKMDPDRATPYFDIESLPDSLPGPFSLEHNDNASVPRSLFPGFDYGDRVI